MNGTDQELNPPAPGLSGRIWESALTALAADVETVYAWGREWLPHAHTLEEKAAVINVHYGTPEQIVESIRAFPAFPYTTELQFSVAYGTASYAQRRARSRRWRPRSRPRSAGSRKLLGWKQETSVSARAAGWPCR